MSNIHESVISVVYPFSLEIFNKNGLPIGRENEVMVLSKLVTSCGRTSWHLLHLN